MKLEEYECVKTKRRAQARIYEQTNNLKFRPSLH